MGESPSVFLRRKVSLLDYHLPCMCVMHLLIQMLGNVNVKAHVVLADLEHGSKSSKVPLSRLHLTDVVG